MSQADILKWDAKYTGVNRPCSAEPDAELIRYASVLPQNGRALDLACGTGKNALFLALQGLDVDAVDGSVEALNRLRASAQGSGMARRVQTIQADFDDYALPEFYYDLVLVVRYLKPSLLPDIATALKPGGMLVYKTFNRNILQQRPAFNLAYTIETNELIAAFPGIELIADNRENTNSVYAFMIGRKASA